jgi:predicted short-subunit dehydrogenase-like oxidoreductase (DUF2520 family)
MPGIPRTFAVVGPGRAGSSLALALRAGGWTAVAVAGRAPDAPAVRGLAERLGCATAAVAEVGVGAALVVLATPDAALGPVAAAVAPSLDRGALVLHCSGARGLDALDPLAEARPDVRRGALHPLQTFAGPDPDRVAGAWAAVAGPPEVTELTLGLGLRPVVVPDGRRPAYHAAAVVASNHLVALLGQVERLAAAAGVPAEAFWPLVRTAVDNVADHGPAAALTGPVARGDHATVAAHLDAIPASEHDAYRVLARAALHLTGRDDPVLRAVLAPGGLDAEVPV